VPNKGRITGNLTLHGVTLPLVLKFKFNGGYSGNPFDPKGSMPKHKFILPANKEFFNLFQLKIVFIMSLLKHYLRSHPRIMIRQAQF
jgi:hypothetical protein